MINLVITAFGLLLLILGFYLMSFGFGTPPNISFFFVGLCFAVFGVIIIVFFGGRISLSEFKVPSPKVAIPKKEKKAPKGPKGITPKKIKIGKPIKPKPKAKGTEELKKMVTDRRLKPVPEEKKEEKRKPPEEVPGKMHPTVSMISEPSEKEEAVMAGEKMMEGVPSEEQVEVKVEKEPVVTKEKISEELPEEKPITTEEKPGLVEEYVVEEVPKEKPALIEEELVEEVPKEAVEVKEKGEKESEEEIIKPFIRRKEVTEEKVTKEKVEKPKPKLKPKLKIDEKKEITKDEKETRETVLNRLTKLKESYMKAETNIEDMIEDRLDSFKGTLNKIKAESKEPAIIWSFDAMDVQETMIDTISKAENKVLMMYPWIRNIDVSILRKFMDTESRMIIQEAGLDDDASVELIKLLSDNNVEIRTLPHVHTVVVVSDEDNGLIISTDPIYESFEVGIVYKDNKSIQEIERLFEEAWNLSNEIKLE